ncbi:hypothetical protein JD276_03545 [Leucobacter sp. CSA1]|uniref:ABC-2 type transport system permease protein n=1 Tax=Leucobacter chromiisoli TaxID=2796471 RepID=A0A934Q7I5_9MICO|nr:hypothetical protein [Leucobacter chromiisoli]MBK0418104.1 hypothetical protein [Leucobacter chromiisoli]
MVAILVGLRWRQLGHQLGRNPWFIVALVVSGLVALGMLGTLALALGALRLAAPDLAVTALVLVGSAITAGWWIGTIFVSSDDSLAPERFALLPVRARSLLPGLTVAGATTIGGIGTTIALLLMLVGWSVSLAAALAATLLAPVALMVCVLGARVIGGLLARWLARRRTRDLVLTLGVLLVACSGLLLNLLLTAVGELDAPSESLAAAADVLAWTPLGAAFGVPAAVAEGEWLVAVLRLAVALATVVVLWLAAERLLAARLVAPISGGGGGRVRSGGLVDRVLPATPVGAVAARTLRYRRRDPRHLVNTVMLLVLPALLLGVFAMNGLRDGGVTFGPALVLLPSINALLICTIVQMDVAYDNDAVALHILTGVRGTADRVGRLLGIGILAIPLTVILCVLACLLVGSWALLPASLGAALGLSLAAAGAASAVGAYLPGRAPAPGANPFGRGSSGGVQSLLAMIVVMPITLVVGGPALGFAIASFWTPSLGWVSLACGLLLGGAATWAGAVIGGRALDRRWPRVLADVSSEA